MLDKIVHNNYNIGVRRKRKLTRKQVLKNKKGKEQNNG